MLKVQSYSANPYNVLKNKKAQSFGADTEKKPNNSAIAKGLVIGGAALTTGALLSKTEAGRKVFEAVGKFCDISPNGSLTRAAFAFVGIVFMVGGRFFKSRSKDEKREVLTRDVTAVALSAAGAPLINQVAAYTVTKKTGVPIVELGAKKNFWNALFSSEKQLTNWYSEFGANPAINLSQTIEKHGGNIRKAFTKLGLIDKLNAVTTATDNGAIITAIKDAQSTGATSLKVLDDAMMSLPKDNNLVKFAKRNQAFVKLGGIAFMAATLGYFLPRLNIITTRKKYQEQLEQGKIDQATYDKKMMVMSPVLRPSAGVLSFHNASAVNTFKPLFNMIEEPIAKN